MLSIWMEYCCHVLPVVTLINPQKAYLSTCNQFQQRRFFLEDVGGRTHADLKIQCNSMSDISTNVIFIWIIILP